jgi:hypothetical protein
MAAERRLSAEAKPFAPPTPLAKVVSRDDDEPPRRRGVIVDNLKVSYGFVRLDDDAAAQDLFLHLTDCAYAGSRGATAAGAGDQSRGGRGRPCRRDADGGRRGGTGAGLGPGGGGGDAGTARGGRDSRG